MSPGKKPEMRLPPNRAALEEKMRDLEKAGEWAKTPAAADAENAGIKPAESMQVDSSTEIVVVDTPITLGTPLRALRRKEKAEEVKFLLRLPADQNERLERLVDQIPRASKTRLIMLALEEFMSRVERVIEKSVEAKVAR